MAIINCVFNNGKWYNSEGEKVNEVTKTKTKTKTVSYSTDTGLQVDKTITNDQTGQYVSSDKTISSSGVVIKGSQGNTAATAPKNKVTIKAQDGTVTVSKDGGAKTIYTVDQNDYTRKRVNKDVTLTDKQVAEAKHKKDNARIQHKAASAKEK